MTKLVILGAHWVNINPDNVATPVAAALGDCIMVSFVTFVASAFWFYIVETGAPTAMFPLFHTTSST